MLYEVCVNFMIKIEVHGYLQKFYIIKLFKAHKSTTFWAASNAQIEEKRKKEKKKKATMAYISSCVVASHFPNQHKDQL